MSSLAPIAELTDEVINETIRINLKGAVNMCREAARRLWRDGRIINASSSVIGMRLPTCSLYAAIEAAVERLMQVLTQEMRGAGIARMPSRRALSRPSCSSTIRARIYWIKWGR